MKINCPVCKSIKEFVRLDISPLHINTYVYGDYVYLHRCPKCHIVIATDEEEK